MAMAMATAYSGVFREGSDGYALWVSEWDSFVAKWQELSGQGLRLTSISVSTDSGAPVFSGVYREGSDGYALWVAPWDSFVAKWQELSGQGLRLVDVAMYASGGVTTYAGVFREGSDGYALWVSAWDSFVAKWQELSGQGLRLVSIATYADGGTPMYAGVYREGSDGYALWVTPWDSFVAKWQELSGQGLRLVSIDSYVAGGERYYAGVYREGGDGHHLWVGVDWENFVAKWHQLAGTGLRLVDTVMYQHPCTSDCLNQVVMPTGSYDYDITRTAEHCPGLPGTCGTPAPGEVVFYRWPVDVDGSARYARLSALEHSDQFLTLPFSDRAVGRGGIWLYGPGSWHHAADYGRGDPTFEVLAAAPGRVLFTGWNNWSGNTVIVSHDVGGVRDAYRTVYMHLRNGATNDGNASWDLTVPTLSDEVLAEFTTHLDDTGCPKDGPRNPDPAHWGTDDQVIAVTPGQQVRRGEFLAWAGNTGPGGKRGPGGPNTHLHIFFARRDLTNDEWYLFDPYGVYAPPGCYAAGVTDATTGPCVRYPVAWQDGRPQYP